MNIGNKIKELRVKNKVTQEELAKVLQVSTQAVSKWENGGSPDLELVPSIATYFNVTTDYLFDMKNSDIVNIDKKVAKYIQSFDLENRMNVAYDLAFKMSIATRGDVIAIPCTLWKTAFFARSPQARSLPIAYTRTSRSFASAIFIRRHPYTYWSFRARILLPLTR